MAIAFKSNINIFLYLLKLLISAIITNEFKDRNY